MLSIFNEWFVSVFASLVSMLFSGSAIISSITKILKAKNTKEAENAKISKSIDYVSKSLEESKVIIEKTILAMNKQKELFEQAKKDAEISQQIASMNQQEINALREVLERALDDKEKKSFPKNFLLNLFFCLLSAVLGFIFGKMF